MSKELIINSTPNEIAIAFLEDKRLVELTKEKKETRFSVGDVYLAKVKKIMPGLNAAFVDVGFHKDAFLHYHDLGPQFNSYNSYLEFVFKKNKAPFFQNFKGKPDIDKNGKISQVLKTGQQLLVQIAKEPISSKGPRLTSEISIAGRHIVLLPFSDKVSVSQKIDSQEERNRLKQLLKSIRPRNYGIIVRTVAEGKKVAELDSELRQLIDKWETALQKLSQLRPPQLLVNELARTTAMVRDILTGSFNNIFLNDENLYNEIRDYIQEVMPDKKKIVKHYRGRAHIFEYFGINKQIKSLFGRIVPFKNGAYLIIEHTEALHVIDVNSGNRSDKSSDQESNALGVNLAAAEEIARQLRLRDMGGIIVVDFIDMHSPENKQRVFEKMKEAMDKDRTKHSILPLSKFGLIQITRQRVRPEINIKTIEKCPTCKGTGEISASILFIDELETEMANIITQYNLKNITVKLHPFIAAYLTQGFFSLRYKWQRKMKCKIKVQSESLFTLFEKDYIHDGLIEDDTEPMPDIEEEINQAENNKA